MHDESREIMDAVAASKASSVLSTSSSSSLSWHSSPVIWNILAVETGERFAYFGFQAILVLYFLRLQYSEKDSIALFAFVSCLAYLSPIAGALLADGSWGRYQTIFRFGCAYFVGLLVLTIAASIESDEALTLRRFFSFGGLILVCLGTGGIKACVSAFGADQVGGQLSTNSKIQQDSKSDLPVIKDNDESENSKRCQLQCYVDQKHPVSADGHQSQQQDKYIVDNQVCDDRREEHLRAFFANFYVGINVGAVTSIALVPLIRSHYGFGAAFAVSTCFMFSVVLLFASKKDEYVHYPVTSSTAIEPNDIDRNRANYSIIATLTLSWWLLKHKFFESVPAMERNVFSSPHSQLPTAAPATQRVTRQLGRRIVASAAERLRGRHTLVPIDDTFALEHSANHKQDRTQEDFGSNDDEGKCQLIDEAAQLLHVLPILVMFPIYWCLYDQQGSVWTLQASRMALHGLEPEQMTLVNPLEIMIFIPLFDRVIYPAMETRSWNISPLRRISWGMVLAAVSFFLSGFLESSIQYCASNDLEQVSVFWQLPQLTILAVSEILLSVTGLEFTYAASPERLKSFVMAIYLSMSAVGDLLGGLLYSTVFKQLSIAVVMHVCGLVMLINLVVFMVVSKWWLCHDYTFWRQQSVSNGGQDDVEMVVIIPEVQMV